MTSTLPQVDASWRRDSAEYAGLHGCVLHARHENRAPAVREPLWRSVAGHARQGSRARLGDGARAVLNCGGHPVDLTASLFLLAGGLRRLERRIRITAQLTDAIS